MTDRVRGFVNAINGTSSDLYISRDWAELYATPGARTAAVVELREGETVVTPLMRAELTVVVELLGGSAATVSMILDGKDGA